MEEINRKQILEGCLEIIKIISSKEYQKRVWILGKGPEVSDFDETSCNFFQIVGGVIEKYKYFGITEFQYKVLKKLYDEYEPFSDDHYWPEDFIDTPEWDKITEMAKEVLKAFNYQN